jgi:hypothetical protein
MDEKKGKAGRPPIYSNQDELISDYLAYLEGCNATDRIATVEGFCAGRGIDPDTYYATIARFPGAKKIIDQATLDQVLNCHRPPGLVIFYLKNRFGWMDTPAVLIDNRSINLDGDSVEIDKLLSKLGYLQAPGNT